MGRVFGILLNVNSNVKLLVLLIIALPICIGASVLILPDKILQALPDNGDQLVSTKEKLRNNFIFWFGGVVQSLESSIGISTDDYNIINGPSVEVQIPIHVVLELGRKKKTPVAILPMQPPDVLLNTELAPGQMQGRLKTVFAKVDTTRAESFFQKQTQLTPLSHQKRRLKTPPFKPSPSTPSEDVIKDKRISSVITDSKTPIAEFAKRLWNTLPSKFKHQLSQTPVLPQSEIDLSVSSKEIASAMGSEIPKGIKIEPVQEVEVKFLPLPHQIEPAMSTFPDLGPSNLGNISILDTEKLSDRYILDQYSPDRNEPPMVNLAPDREERDLASPSPSQSDREVTGQPLVRRLVTNSEMRQKTMIYADGEPEIKPVPLPYPVNSRIQASFGEVPLDRLRALEPNEYTFSAMSEENEGGRARRLGMQYYWGNSVPKNLRKAARWFLRAANTGDARAQYILGLMALLGQGMRKNYAEAVKWLHKASQQDHAAAQYNLGLLYYAGQGVPKDDQTAYNWFNRAANLGNQPAKNARDTLQSFLPLKKVQN